MNIKQDEISSWVDSLDDFKPDYEYYKCTSFLMFFRLIGRKSTLIKDNLIPIPNLHYAIYSPLEKRYYYKTYRGYELDCLYYYRPSLTWGGEDEEVTGLRNKIRDGNIWMLLTLEQVKDMQCMLDRVSKAQLTSNPVLKYKDFLRILEISLQIEDYKIYYSNAHGFRTNIHVWEQELNMIWRQVASAKK